MNVITCEMVEKAAKVIDPAAFQAGCECQDCLARVYEWQDDARKLARAALTAALDVPK